MCSCPVLLSPSVTPPSPRTNSSLCDAQPSILCYPAQPTKAAVWHLTGPAVQHVYFALRTAHQQIYDPAQSTASHLTRQDGCRAQTTARHNTSPQLTQTRCSRLYAVSHCCASAQGLGFDGIAHRLVLLPVGTLTCCAAVAHHYTAEGACSGTNNYCTTDKHDQSLSTHLLAHAAFPPWRLQVIQITPREPS